MVTSKRLPFIHAYQLGDFCGFETKHHRPNHTFQDCDIVELRHNAIEPDPFDDIAGRKFDDLQSTPRFCIPLKEF